MLAESKEASAPIPMNQETKANPVIDEMEDGEMVDSDYVSSSSSKNKNLEISYDKSISSKSGASSITAATASKKATKKLASESITKYSTLTNKKKRNSHEAQESKESMKNNSNKYNRLLKNEYDKELSMVNRKKIKTKKTLDVLRPLYCASTTIKYFSGRRNNCN